jgi:hypothetical protein
VKVKGDASLVHRQLAHLLWQSGKKSLCQKGFFPGRNVAWLSQELQVVPEEL